MHRYDFQRQGLAVCLAGLAGYVDAVGFLSADNYFVSFMSGNTTRLAVDLARDWRSAATPALLIAGFTSGVAAGHVLAVRTGVWRKPAILALVCLLLFVAAMAHLAQVPALSTGLLVVAMGTLNNTFQRDGEISIGLTYMTGALVRLGQAIGAALTGQRRSGWGAYLLLWSGLATGGLCGALSWLRLGALALWPAVLGTIGLALFALWLARIEARAPESWR